MSVSYITAAKTDRLQVIADRVNGKTISAATGTATNGSLVIGTSSFTNTAGTTSITTGTTGVIVIIPLPNAGVTVSGTALNLVASSQSATATLAGTNTAANAAVINNAGTIVTGGLTVGTSSADVIVGSTSISSGQTVTVSSAQINHA